MFLGKEDKDVRLTDKQYKDLVGGKSKYGIIISERKYDFMRTKVEMPA